MCGIVGVWDTTKQTTRATVQQMSQCMQHRGPDDHGLYVSEGGEVLFAQQRLSLIDLSSAGHQPMHIGKHVMVYNGEVYNYAAIRDELFAEEVTCTGDSDTEVVLRAWLHWGPTALEKFRGMFSFAIWDEELQTLTVCRDRAGVKPLYLYQQDGVLIFGSEIKAILTHPQVVKKIDQDALQLYLQLGYVPAPYSIFSGISKIPPAHYCVFDRIDHSVSTCYWSVDALEPQEMDEEAALSELDQQVRAACELRMIADVPVGVFLSGGIDSSLVTAMLKAQGYANLSTFTIGFAESTHNEAAYARAVAEHLGTEHHELTCTTKDAQAIIPLLPKMFDEPFADASAIPTYLLSQFTKGKVTAALSADGGDELFGGYARYQSGENIFTIFSKLPPGLGPFIWVGVQATRVLVRLRLVDPNRVHKFKKVYWYYRQRRSVVGSYAVQQSYFSDREIKKLLRTPSSTFTSTLFAAVSLQGLRNHMRKLQRIDFHTYLPDDVLVKVDRASMAVSLEGREPLLDHHLIEFAGRIPDALMHKEPGKKYLLRQLLYRYLPQALVDRPKQGFGVPLNNWLKGDLRGLFDEFLEEKTIREQGVFRYETVQKELNDFLAGAQPYNRIWNILMFQMWYKEYLTNDKHE